MDRSLDDIIKSSAQRKPSGKGGGDKPKGAIRKERVTARAAPYERRGRGNFRYEDKPQRVVTIGA